MDNSIQSLDLPDVRVLNISKTEQGDLLIRIESILNGTICHKCGRQTTHCHGYDRPIRLRHLALFDVPIFVEIRPKRYQCEQCEGNHDAATELV